MWQWIFWDFFFGPAKYFSVWQDFHVCQSEWLTISQQVSGSLDSRTRGNHRLGQIRAKNDTYQHSFFPRSIREWNRVPSSVVDADFLEDFKVRLNSIPCQTFITTQINDRAAVWCIYCTWLLLVHLDQRFMWTIAITWRPSSVSHFKLLLRNHWANWKQT